MDCRCKGKASTSANKVLAGSDFREAGESTLIVMPPNSAVGGARMRLPFACPRLSTAKAIRARRCRCRRLSVCADQPRRLSSPRQAWKSSEVRSVRRWAAPALQLTGDDMEDRESFQARDRMDISTTSRSFHHDEPPNPDRLSDAPLGGLRLSVPGEGAGSRVRTARPGAGVDDHTLPPACGRIR